MLTTTKWEDIMKKSPVFLLILGLLLCLTACGEEEPDPVITLVQGNLDAVYAGTWSEEYLALTGLTAEDCQAAYENNLEAEARHFLAYYGYSDEGLEDDVFQDIIELYRDLYRHAAYTVGPAARLDEETQAVKVQITPLNLFALAEADTELREALFAPIQKTYYWMNLETIDWSNPAIYAYNRYYAQCRAECVAAQVALCRAQLDKLAEAEPAEPRTVVVQVYWHPYGYWTIDDTDWKTVDSLMIEYP